MIRNLYLIQRGIFLFYPAFLAAFFLKNQDYFKTLQKSKGWIFLRTLTDKCQLKGLAWYKHCFKSHSFPWVDSPGWGILTNSKEPASLGSPFRQGIEGPSTETKEILSEVSSWQGHMPLFRATFLLILNISCLHLGSFCKSSQAGNRSPFNLPFPSSLSTLSLFPDLLKHQWSCQDNLWGISPGPLTDIHTSTAGNACPGLFCNYIHLFHGNLKLYPASSSSSQVLLCVCLLVEH